MSDSSEVRVKLTELGKLVNENINAIQSKFGGVVLIYPEYKNEKQTGVYCIGYVDTESTINRSMANTDRAT